MTAEVTIDCFPSSLSRYGAGWAVIGVDVIRATTTAVTAVATGRRCFPVPDLARARALGALLADPVLAGELGGDLPDGFDENNSPAALARRDDVARPLVLLSTAGTQLIHEVGPREAVYAGCLRNITATVQHVAATHERVAVVGAGTRGQFRLEDQLGCAWLAEGLLEAGFVGDARTLHLVDLWRDAPVDAITDSPSADYLRRSHQEADLQFVLTHVDDLDCVTAVRDGELVALPGAQRGASPLARVRGGAA